MLGSSILSHQASVDPVIHMGIIRPWQTHGLTRFRVIARRRREDRRVAFDPSQAKNKPVRRGGSWRCQGTSIEPCLGPAAVHSR